MLWQGSWQIHKIYEFRAFHSPFLSIHSSLVDCLAQVRNKKNIPQILLYFLVDVGVNGHHEKKLSRVSGPKTNFHKRKKINMKNGFCSRSRKTPWFFTWWAYIPILNHTGYIEVIMQRKCGRNTETTFDIKWVIGTYGNWKNQNPGGRFGATS